MTCRRACATLGSFPRPEGGCVHALDPAYSRIDTLWVLMAGVLVFFMQAGFLLLEVGFSRMKNAGTVVAKVIATFSIAAICYWAVGFALACGASKTPATA